MGGTVGGIVGGVLGGGTGAKESKGSEQMQQSSWPAVIPRQPPVMPRLGTSGGSYINVRPTYYNQPNAMADALPGAVTAGEAATGPSATEQLNTPWFTAATLPSTPGVNVFGGEVANPVQYLNKIVDPARYAELEAQVEQEKGGIKELSPYIPTGLDINVGINESIASDRNALGTAFEKLGNSVQQTMDRTKAQIDNISTRGIQNVSLPQINRMGFKELKELGDTQRQQLGAIDTQLSQEINQLEQMYERLGSNEGSFIEARTRPLMESRAKAERDASRRGISGPLAALATNPYDTQISDERAKAQGEIEDARLKVRAHQTQLQGARMQIQEQYEQVRQGELKIISTKFQQEASVFQSKLAKAQAVESIKIEKAKLNEIVLAADQLKQSILQDRSGLVQQQLQQEVAELGLGMEAYNLIIGSQLNRPTAQYSQGSSSGSTSGSTQGDVIGDIGRIAYGIQQII